MNTITLHQLRCEYATGTSPRVTYLLTPIAVDGATIDRWAKEYDTYMVVISGTDWNTDMTPWQAPNVKSKYPDFAGGAPQFMTRLADTMAQMEQMFGLTQPIERTLIGTSLSGLFATWAWLTGDLFRDIVCLSGSFWYPGFVQWLQRLDIPHKKGRAYFSLGDQEKHSRNPLFASIDQRTGEVMPLLRKAGIRLFFETVPGAHHGGMVERIDKGLTWLNRDASKA